MKWSCGVAEILGVGWTRRGVATTTKLTKVTRDDSASVYVLRPLDLSSSQFGRGWRLEVGGELRIWSQTISRVFKSIFELLKYCILHHYILRVQGGVRECRICGVA